MMVAEGNTFRHKQSGEYERTHLRTPFRIISLMIRNFYGRDDGKMYNFGWIPLMYYVAMEGTIFNWADIATRNLSKCVKEAQEGLKQSKSEFFMSSFLIDCILYRHKFERLKCVWKGGNTPIYTAYQILEARKYHNHYQLICEEFIRPLYKLIFLEECPCLSKGAVEFIKEYGYYFFTEEGTYLRIYGGTKAPSLLPKYATNYIVHKEAVR